jgi:hypothetical protein
MGAAESRAQFRLHIARLHEEEVPAEPNDFWQQLWTVPKSAEEVFTLVQPDDVRTLRKERPKNLETLLQKALSKLLEVVQTPRRQLFPEALNCVRILTRVFPFLYENPSENAMENLFSAASGQSSSPFTQLIHATMQLLFLQDFSVSFPGGGDMEYHLWAKGIMNKSVPSISSVAFDRNRKEVLKLLLVCFCETLYYGADDYLPPNRMLKEAVAEDCPFAASLFYSLMNIICDYDPVGWGVPYAGLLGVDERESLADMSLQVLLVLLDCNIHSPERGDGARAEPANIYQQLLSQISSKEDFNLIFSAFARLLNNIHEAHNTYLPNSMKEIQCQQELLVLLWKVLDHNKAFMTHILKYQDITQLVVPIMYLMFEGRKDPSKVHPTDA